VHAVSMVEQNRHINLEGSSLKILLLCSRDE